MAKCRLYPWTRYPIWVLVGASAGARDYIVAPSGGDFTTIQAALDIAVAGDSIKVMDKAGGYHEKIRFPRSGSAAAGWISLEAFRGHAPILDGTGVSGKNLVLIEDRSYVRIRGLEIRNHLGVSDASGIRVLGAGTHLEILDNDIHHITGFSAMGITVYGTSATESIRNLRIAGNRIHDCEPFDSEALTLNGNVEQFEVIGNHVHDVNNIGIDFIAGESDINPVYGVRSGVCRGNRVERARERTTGGYAGGIYVDGASDVLVEDNIVSECDLGLEVGAENQGIDAVGVVVRDNLLFHNDKAGLVFGGYDRNVGRVRSCRFENNTLNENDQRRDGVGEIWIQYASDNQLLNNVVVSHSAHLVLYSERGNSGNLLDGNLWFTPSTSGVVTFVWNGAVFDSLEEFRNATGQDPLGRFADPRFVAPAQSDYRPRADSPVVDSAIEAGVVSGVDAAGHPRLLDGDLDRMPALDRGAFEYSAVELALYGSFTPGGVATLKLDGVAGLPTVLWIGTRTGELRLNPFGSLFVDLQSPWNLQPWLALPSTTQFSLPVDLPLGTTIVVQALALQGVSGHLSQAGWFEVE